MVRPAPALKAHKLRLPTHSQRSVSLTFNPKSNLHANDKETATGPKSDADKAAEKLNSISAHGKSLLLAAEAAHKLGAVMTEVLKPWNLGGHYELVLRLRKLSKAEAAALLPKA